MKKTARVDITLDVICIWSYLAFTRYRRAAARFRAEGGHVDLTIRSWQVEPGAVGGRSKLDQSLARFGESGVARVNALAAAEGIPLAFAKAVTADTRHAHHLIAMAADQGLAEVATARLFQAHFVDGAHIGDLGVLRALAAELGVRWDETVPVSWARDVTAVPVFRFDGRPALNGGTLSEEVLYGQLAVL
ncbi:DsbA family protein [Streptosporangium sp. NPDC020145]|uniref:DsbA family oxidoreductase n=1 Tax=Streptosporangium sp. NPDC020145 TaxID=3154694 RepID=UPI00343610AC